MKALLRALVISALIASAGGGLCSGQDTQSDDPHTESTADHNTPPQKAKRVWTEDDLQQLSGPVNVVGQQQNSSSGEQQPAANSAPQSRYKLEFKARTLDGSVITEDETKGKVLLVQFWATWCPHSRNDQAPVDRVYSNLAGKGLVVIGIDMGESEQEVREYLSKRPRSSPVVIEKETNLVNLLPSPDGYPTYVVVDRNGNIADSRSGELGEAGLRKLLHKAGL